MQQVLAQKEVPSPCGVLSNVGTCRIEENTIQLQMDEGKTKSQEDDKKWNLTYTATLETSEHQCFYLTAESSEKLIQQVLAYFVVLGLYLGKRLEVIREGAGWMGEWVGSIQDTSVEQVLCWYHLCKRIWESIKALGLAKEERKLLVCTIYGVAKRRGWFGC